jgi:hypothetical protein
VQPATENIHEIFQDLISSIARPLGVLRVASTRHELKLPFRRTLEKGLGRYVAVENPARRLDVPKLCRALLQNAGRSLSELDEVITFFSAEDANQTGVPNSQLVHGKDLARLISWKFDIAYGFAENFIMLALATEAAVIRREPNIRIVGNWLN